MPNDDAPLIRVQRETMHDQAQVAALLGPAERETFAAIDGAAAASDIELLRTRANRAVIAEAQTAAMAHALELWRRTIVRLLLEGGMSADEIAGLLDRVEEALADELPHVAAGHAFDIAEAVDRILQEGAT